MILSIVIVSLIASLLTFELGNKEKIGTVAASCFLTLFSYFDLSLINYFYPIDVEFYLTVFYGASLIGMSSKVRFNYINIAWASFIYAILFNSFLPLLKGLGGSLGLSAFISVAIVHLVREIIKNIKSILINH